MVGPLRHRQTKEAETDMFGLQPPRHIPTPPDSEVSKDAVNFRFLGMSRHAPNGLLWAVLDPKPTWPIRYSITLSAVANSVTGMVRPSALAVLTLIASSNLVGCWTGRSAGFSPLRMRPV